MVCCAKEFDFGVVQEEQSTEGCGTHAREPTAIWLRMLEVAVFALLNNLFIHVI